MSDYYSSMDREAGIGISAKEMGFTTIPNKDQLDELKAKIRMGVSKVELGFTGQQKSSGEQPSPEAYGKEEREAIRELSKINDVELTTHAAMVNLAGQSKEGGFNEMQRKAAVDEVRRAIDFAADTTEGGAVVAHMWEFNRPVSKHKDEKFEGFYSEYGEGEKKESEEAVVQLADDKTGQVIDSVKKDMDIFLPEYEPNDDGTFETDEKGNPVPKIDDEGLIVMHEQPYTWKELKEKTKIKDDDELALWLFKRRVDEQSDTMRGRMAYEQDFLQRSLEQKDKLLREGFSEDSNEVKRVKDSIESYQSGIASLRQQMSQMKKQVERVKPIEDVAMKRTKQSLAESAMHAYEKEQKKKLKKSLYVAPENVFPEQYGSHPDELKKIVTESRDVMTKMLMRKKKMSEKKAKKIAEDHIKATFDVGHAYTWKRYFKGSDEDFDKWFMKKVDELAESNVIGHVHVSDNMGYYDEHLIPGQGNVPIKEAVEKLKKKGVDFIVEAGREGEKAWTGALREFGRPVYGMSRQNSWDPWNVIEHSYFSRTAPPYFVVGEYAQQFGERVGKDFSSWAGIPFD